VTSGPSILNDAALESVRKWVYEPMRGEDGSPVEARLTVSIKFALS
jgi:outer membrane biosynthesis protein TonB